MAKWLGGAVVALVVLLVLAQLVPVDRSNPPVTREVKWSSPDVKALAKRACYDCHSNETVWNWTSRVAPVSWLVARDVAEGRQKLNFSQWDQPVNEPNEIPNAVARGGMPPATYTMGHPEAKLTPAERQALQAGLADTLRQDPPVAGGGQEEGER